MNIVWTPFQNKVRIHINRVRFKSDQMTLTPLILNDSDPIALSSAFGFG